MKKIALYLLVSFLGVYLTKLMISPVYISVLVALILLFSLYKDSQLYVDKIVYLLVFCMIYYASYFLRQNLEINLAFGIVFSYLVFILIMVFGYQYDKEELIKVSFVMIDISIFVLIFECVYRLAHPVYEYNFYDLHGNDLWFYWYKYSSIMYLDSNFVGLQIISLIGFILVLSFYVKKNILLRIVLLLVLLVLTFSRASILSIIVMLLFYIYRRYFMKQRVLLVLAVLLMYFIYTYTNDDIILMDNSYLSKFYIIEVAVEKIRSMSITELMFGYGFGQAENKLNIGAHNIIVLLLFETGIIGLSVFFTGWFIVLKKSQYILMILLYPVFLNMISVSNYSMAYLYGACGVILVIKDKVSDKILQ